MDDPPQPPIVYVSVPVVQQISPLADRETNQQFRVELKGGAENHPVEATDLSMPAPGRPASASSSLSGPREVDAAVSATIVHLDTASDAEIVYVSIPVIQPIPEKAQGPFVASDDSGTIRWPDLSPAPLFQAAQTVRRPATQAAEAAPENLDWLTPSGTKDSLQTLFGTIVEQEGEKDATPLGEMQQATGGGRADRKRSVPILPWQQANGAKAVTLFGTEIDEPSENGAGAASVAATGYPDDEGVASRPVASSTDEGRVDGEKVDQPGGTREPPAAPPVLLDLELIFLGRSIGNVPASISTEAVYEVDAKTLARVAASMVSAETLSALEDVSSGMVAVDRLEVLGLRIGLDPRTLTLELQIDEQSLRPRLFTASSDERFSGYERVAPDAFAVGVTAALTLASDLDNGLDPDARLDFAGFANVGGSDGLNLDYSGAFDYRAASRSVEFRRGRFVAFKDWVDHATTASFGDLIPFQGPLVGAIDIGGISFSRNYERTQPLRNIRPRASSRFDLERPSIVEVYVNGTLIERFSADPGPIAVDQIPSVGFSNQVSIIVEDEFGRREVDNLVFGSDIELLGKGVEQFDFALGFLRDEDSFGLEYSDALVASGYYERGLSDRLTASAGALASQDLQSLSGGLAYSLGSGVVTAGVALSHSSGSGAGASASIGFRGSPFFGPEAGEFADIELVYTSPDYRSLDRFDLRSATRFNLRAAYQTDLNERVAVFGNASIIERHSGERDLFGSGGLRFGMLGGQFSLAGRFASRSGRGDDFGVLASISLPLGSRGSVFGNFDASNGNGRLEYRRLRDLALPALDYRVGFERRSSQESAFGGLTYSNSRFDVSADVSHSFAGSGFTGTTAGRIRVQSGLAITDSAAAIGRDPGRGFAIVKAHDSLADARFDLSRSSAGQKLAFVDGFGPAVIPVDTPYRAQPLFVDARRTPVGYDLGSGRYLLEPGARSGMSIQLGDDAFRSGLGILVDRGEPVSLVYGLYYRDEDRENSQQTFFTNRSGRALFADLAPGRYTVEIESLGRVGSFSIGEDDEAFVDFGLIEMRAK
ncbi:MAG: fimbria/pilus outer membrane usher protein [Parvularcula sp.]|jgi:outer membrane usher protein FimD/PapC|nr:fimbria/pilus outer membrane usher protein [Parvularcula sp.]